MQVVDEVYFTPQEIATRLKVSDASVLRWIREKRLNATRLPGGWRITETDLSAFLAARRESQGERD